MPSPTAAGIEGKAGFRGFSNPNADSALHSQLQLHTHNGLNSRSAPSRPALPAHLVCLATLHPAGAKLDVLRQNVQPLHPQHDAPVRVAAQLAHCGEAEEEEGAEGKQQGGGRDGDDYGQPEGDERDEEQQRRLRGWRGEGVKAHERCSKGHGGCE